MKQSVIHPSTMCNSKRWCPLKVVAVKEVSYCTKFGTRTYNVLRCVVGMDSKSVDGRFVQTPNERRIIELLKKRIGRKASAAELAKHVGFPTKKGVNPLLYDMQKRGVIRKIQESPPLWQLIVTATNSGPGGYLQAGSGRYGSAPRENKPLSPEGLLPRPEDGQLQDPGPGDHPQPWKRPRFDTPSSGSTSGIPSLLDMEPGQIGPNTMNYSTSLQQHPNKGKKNDSVRTILTNLNAQRKGGTAQAHGPQGTGSDFKPPPSPMEMLHGGAAGVAGYQTTASSPFTSSVLPSSRFATSLSNHTHNVPKRTPSGGGGGSSGIASWLSTPTRPSWMKFTAGAGVTGTSLNSNQPAAPNVSSLLPTTDQGVQNNTTTAPQRLSPTPRQPAKKVQSVNSLLKQINANRKGAYSPQPGAARPTTSTVSEKFVPPPSPAELLSKAGAPQLTAPPTAQPPIGRLSPNMMAQQPPSTGNGRGALLAGLQGNHSNAGRPPGGGPIGLGVGLTTAGIKGSDASAKFAGNFFFYLHIFVFAFRVNLVIERGP